MSYFSFWIMAFSTNFCPFTTDLFGNTVWPQVSGFQKLVKLNETFSVIFKHKIDLIQIVFDFRWSYSCPLRKSCSDCWTRKIWKNYQWRSGAIAWTRTLRSHPCGMFYTKLWLRNRFTKYVLCLHRIIIRQKLFLSMCAISHFFPRNTYLHSNSLHF